MSWRAALAAVLCALVSTVSANQGPGQGQGQGQGLAVGQAVEIEGTLDVRVEDHATGEIILYSIETSNGRWNVHIPPGQLKNLLSGSRVRARGHVQGQNTLDLGADGGLALLAPAAPNTFGDQRTVVILVNFTDNLGSPVTAPDAAAVTFGQVNSFYQENSYGQTSVSGDVYGLYTIPMSSSVCDSNQLATLADQQATSHGVNLSLYTRKVYSFPNNACTWWGLGTVGGQPSQAWINGTFSLKVVGHEMGHNFGDYHSKSSPCDPAGGCSMLEYGDDRDIMGQSGIGHLNAFQKERLGWLNYGSSPGIQSVTGPGTYWIDSLQTLGGTKALKILQSSTSGNTYYYVEARTQTGFDAGYGPGVILHTGNDTDGNTSVQVDLDPQTTAFDSVLDPGQSFVDASIALTITTSSMEAGGAWVTVQMPQGPPCTYSISPTSSGTLSASGASSSFSMTAGAGCTWSASSPQSWIHTTSTGAGNGTVSYFIDGNNGGARTGSISVGGKSYTVSQAAAPCTYALNPTSSGTLSGAGASGSTQMTAGSGCAWSATTTKTWIHTSSTGTGNGTLSYTIDANTGVARTGTIKAGGQTYTINQAAQVVGCSYSLSPTSSGALVAAGASGSFSVITAAGCTWSAATGDAWIHTSSSGGGNGTVSFTVDANTGDARNGSISVGGQTFAVSQAAAPCSYSISPASSGTLSASATSGSFSVTSAAWCSWSSSTTFPWIHAASSGSGNGTVTFTVDANTGAARSGSISVGGQTFSVSQDAAACSYSISPTSSGTLASSATSGSFSVTSAAWCSWSSSTTFAWIHTSSSGSGNGTVTFTVDANSGTARSGSISVGGQTFSVSQDAAACSYSISPASSGTLSASGDSGTFSVTSSSWCSWSSSTTFPWIHTASSGSGAGSVTFTVDANSGASRSGSISAGGQTFAVSQDAAACSYSISPASSGTLSASGASGTFSVTSSSWCSWSSSTTFPWIHTPSSGTGSGTVTFTVDANTGAPRSGSISIAGQAYSVSQAAPGCSYSLSSTSASLSSASGSGGFNVTAADWCNWTATTGDSWIHVMGASSGNGTVSYAFDANGGPARNGSIAVGDQVFSISQAAADCSYALSPSSSGTLASSAASGTFSVTSSSWCSWSSSTAFPWIHTASSGTGSGTVTFTVDANAGAARSGSISAGGQTFAISQAAADCSYALSPTSSGTLASSASSGTFSVTSSSWCSWSSSTTFPWIHTASNGTGSGSVSFTVDANTGAARSGSIFVGGQTFAVSQDAAGCSYSISPASSGTLSASGASGTFSVTSSSWCSWSSSTTFPWIHTSSSGTGNGTTTFTVDANTGAARSGSISVGGQTFAVSQAAAACSYSISPASSGTLPSISGGGSFNVTAGSWCSWTATSGDTWLHVSSSGTGNGPVTFTLDANSGAARNGSISVGGQTFAVSQAAAACNYSINPSSSGTLASSATSGSFSVTSAAWCSWSSSTTFPWIHTSSSGSGNGTVTFTVDANTGAARNGSISVGGQTFAVSQASAPCSYSISPTASGTLASSATSGSFSVISLPSCTWTATTTAGWVHTTSTGTGSGTVIYTVDNNNGAARTGTISVGGQTFTVSQAAGNCKTLALSTSQLAASGGSGSVTAQAAQGPCKKGLTSNASWLTAALDDPASQTSTLTWTADANTGPARVGTITIDDQTLTIYQDGPGNSNGGGKKNGHDDDFTAVVDPSTGLPTQWIATATSNRRFIESLGSFDLTSSVASGASSVASFYLESRLVATLSSARFEISTDETKWTTLANVPTSTDWIGLSVDLSAYAGQVIYIRAVFDAAAPTIATATPDNWSIRNPILIRR